MCVVVRDYPEKPIEAFDDSFLSGKKAKKRFRLYQEYGFVCVGCKKKADKLKLINDGQSQAWFPFVGDKMLTRDHIIPKSKGGPDELFNLQPMCVDCNREKDCKCPNNVAELAEKSKKVQDRLREICKEKNVLEELANNTKGMRAKKIEIVAPYVKKIEICKRILALHYVKLQKLANELRLRA